MPLDDAGARVTAERKDRRHVDPASWLADEVVIDFPSVGAVVERMRDAFWHGSGDPDDDLRLLAEVELSAREAFDGASVPLQIPLRATCHLCGGRGETWTESCLACKGSGEAVVRHSVTLSVPARVPDGASFRFSIRAPQALPTRVEIRVAIR
jgi:hypothetical protein